MDCIVVPFVRFQELYNEEPLETGITQTIQGLKSRFPCLLHTSQGTPGGHGGGHHGAHGGNGGRWGNQDGHSHTNGHGGHHGHRRGHRHGRGAPPSARRADRPRIGTRELSREDISRKDFMANMNKLSRQNYDAILRLIRTTYNSNFLPNYMDILWTMMIRQPDFQDLHIQVIQHLLTITPPERKTFVQTYWDNRCKVYFQEKQWTPSDDLLLTASQDEYDEFCDYIKWKKTTGASLVAWLRLMEHAVIAADYDLCFNAVIDSIQTAFQQRMHKYIECLLEWFVQMASIGLHAYHFPADMDFILNDWLETIKERGLSSSLRFKIMDVREHIHLKN